MIIQFPSRALPTREAGASVPPSPARASRHYSDDDGDFITGLRNALMIEGMIAVFVFAAFAINVRAIINTIEAWL